MKFNASAGLRMLIAPLLVLTGISQGASSPELTLMGMRDALVQNDLKSLAHLAMAPSELERERLKIDRRKERPQSAEQRHAYQRKHFDEGYGTLLGPDAVTRIMVEYKPRLAELRTPMLAGQLHFFMEANKALAESKDLSEQQKAELQALLNATQMYLARTDVLDATRFQKALQEVVLAARAAGVYSLDQLEQLQFDERLSRFSVFLSAGKRALAHYDLDVNSILRSARFRTLEQDDERAKVEVELTVLDVQVHFPLKLHAQAGHWYFIPAAGDYRRRSQPAVDDHDRDAPGSTSQASGSNNPAAAAPQAD